MQLDSNEELYEEDLYCTNEEPRNYNIMQTVELYRIKAAVIAVQDDLSACIR